VILPAGFSIQDTNNYFLGERLAFDLMFGIVFGDEYEMVSKPENRAVLDAISTSAVRVGVLIQAPELKENRSLNKWLFPKQIAARTEFIKFVNHMLQSKDSKSQTEVTDRRNLFTILTKAKDPDTGEGLQASEIGAESTTLIIAGIELLPILLCKRYPEPAD